MGQSNNVSLLNSQASSTKPKTKLSLKAATFNTGGFQVPNIDTSGQDPNNNKHEKQGSRSEPNSARNSTSKNAKAGFTGVTYQEEKEEEMPPEQETGGKKASTNINSGNPFATDNQQPQFIGGGGFEQSNNTSQNQPFNNTGQPPYGKIIYKIKI